MSETNDAALSQWLQQARSDPKMAVQPLIIVLALAFLGYKFLIAPQKVILAKELKKNKGVQDQIAALTKAAGNLEKVREEVEKLRKVREHTQALCYSAADRAAFLRDVRAWGGQAGLQFKSLQPIPPVSRNYEKVAYEEVGVKVGFHGDFAQLGTFLRILEMQEKVIFLKLPPLTPDASGTFRFDLQPTAFFLLD